ncbi:MAG: hypothetical protein M0T74_16910, partial [Desulfitobacterium hafniense]|nr:hypothetical protein [Desulfitobacterium hafniense]
QFILRRLAVSLSWRLRRNPPLEAFVLERSNLSGSLVRAAYQVTGANQNPVDILCRTTERLEYLPQKNQNKKPKKPKKLPKDIVLP